MAFSTFTGRLHGAQAYAWAIVAVALWTSAAMYELQVKNRTIQANTRAKGRFLAAMSHEVRTPMTAIMGVTEELLESELTPEQVQALGVIQDLSRNLVRIVNDILDDAKIGEGKLAVVAKPSRVKSVTWLKAGPCALDKGP
jgi:signal transduction histidine kinase